MVHGWRSEYNSPESNLFFFYHMNTKDQLAGPRENSVVTVKQDYQIKNKWIFILIYSTEVITKDIDGDLKITCLICLTDKVTSKLASVTREQHSFNTHFYQHSGLKYTLRNEFNYINTWDLCMFSLSEGHHLFLKYY